MKKISKILVLMLVLSLSFSLVSCGGDSSEKASSSDTKKPDASGEVSGDASGDDSNDSSADASADSSSDTSSDSSEDNSSAEDVVTAEAKAYYGSPKVDATDIDPLWENVPEYKGENIRWTAGTGSDDPNKKIEDTYTRFTFKLMWDESYLYVLEYVTDSTI